MPKINFYSAPDVVPHNVRQKPDNGCDKIASIKVISDGTAGMRSQALALGEAIKASRHPATNLEDIIVTPPPLLRHLPRLARYLPIPWLRLMVGPKLVTPSISNPAIIITCGRRMAGVSIAMQRLSRATAIEGKSHTIHIQDPRLPPQYFDILIKPQHDPTSGPNVINSMGALNRLTDAKIAHAATVLDQKWTNLPAPCVAVLLGGDSRRYVVSATMVANMAKKLRRFAVSTNASLAIIPSRRTPSKLLNQLTKLLKKTPHTIMNLTDENPYPGILGHAVAIIVTSDSVNMASEAAITGKPVLIAEWQAETGRIRSFHKAMMEAGHTAPLGTFIPTTGFIPLFEMPFILRRVNDLLLQ